MVKARPLFAAALAGAMIVTTPRGARAEPQVEPTPWLVPMTDAESLRPRILAQTSEALARARAELAIPGATPAQPLAISRDGKIIIIVAAIVVGVIILVGVFAISGPHHP